MKKRLRIRPQVELMEGRTLLSAGALDTTFGGTGMVTTTVGSASNSNAVAVQSDSKVVVVGWSAGKSSPKSPAGPFTIARYNTNGSLDSMFGSGGVAVVPIGRPVSLPFIPELNDEAFAVAIQPADGKILVAGTSSVQDKKNPTYYYSDWALARLNPNGTLDTTFGAGKGYVMTQVSPELTKGGENYAESIVLQANGQIVVGGALEGQSGSGTINGLALVRYNTNGSLDTTFGTGGEVVNTGISPSYPGPMTMAIDGSGRIDVAGQSTVGTGGQAVARYLASGTLDSTFGTGGVAGPLPLGSASGVALQSSGKIVVDGYTTPQATLVRLNSDGSLDTTFGVSGIYNESRMGNFGPIVIQPADDKIVAVGPAWVNGQLDPNFWVTRVLANGSAFDSAFGTNGLTEANVNNSSGSIASSGPSSVALDSSGRILVTGPANLYNGSTISYYFATARFLGDTRSTPSIQVAFNSNSTWLAASNLDPRIDPLVWEDQPSLSSPAMTKQHHK